MFAVEGSAANLYLLYLAYAFKRDQSNASARKVFLCSLWYLPLLLGAYIFHSKVWNETMHTEDMVSHSIHDITDTTIVPYSTVMKSICALLIKDGNEITGIAVI